MTRQRAVRASLMRGGTSKGLVLHAAELPDDPTERDALLLAAMGSPDPRQIDGVGGAHPLTSKVAVVRPSDRPDADVEYLFLQVRPDRREVSGSQNCGNMLVAVGPFAVDEGLVPVAAGATTPVRIWLANTASLAVAHVPTEGGAARYDGDTRIDGVPGTHAAVAVDFAGLAGSSCGALLPTGNRLDVLDGVRVTCVDNGMPVVCVAAAELGVGGYESPAELEGDRRLVDAVESLRLAAGAAMGLGDVRAGSVPKVSLLAPPRAGGLVSTRTFIPHRVHDAVGVFGAVSVATACLLPGSVADGIARRPDGDHQGVAVEHPSGRVEVVVELADSADVEVRRAGIVSTARLLMRGEVLVPGAVAP
ncbi:4-oxalomesaconate tautomerase [Jatrophihabitans endophyticus]|uniref:4-oxalomesaconate tautomerase n=1 Tax=Jatrophihabitans endophyticus TaxID=1206085 RepID=A0A1M5ELF0_9ACTN|nr:4-oxalomesaconate tautomerase [Jatrophihabitans endophyticus]SHF79901.1 4-oxalomesaconate tautomerase [Jatrophihabitans endophyticus]